MILLRLSRGVGPLAMAARWATRSSHDHCGFKLEDGSVLDAHPRHGVSVRLARDDADTIYFRFMVPTKLIETAVKWAALQVGKPYDWTALAGWLVRRDWQDDRAWTGSELIVAAFAHAGWPLLKTVDHAKRVAPRDLLMSTRITKAKDQW